MRCKPDLPSRRLCTGSMQQLPQFSKNKQNSPFKCINTKVLLFITELLYCNCYTTICVCPAAGRVGGCEGAVEQGTGVWGSTSPAVRDSSTKAVMTARSLSRQGMVRGVAVRASSVWAWAMGDASPPCRLVAGMAPAPKPDRASLCASTHSLPPCKTASAAVCCCSHITVAECAVSVLVVGW